MVAEHLIFDEKANQFLFVNEDQLANALQDISSDVSLEEIKKDIEHVNSVLKNNLELMAQGELQYGTMSFSLCSAALSALGLFHGIHMQAAMMILGVATTPALLAITAVTGAIWVGGALMCP
nr:hypothetical protein [Caldalkalibacillus thermarum]